MKPANFKGNKLRRQFDARFRLDIKTRPTAQHTAEIAVLDSRIPAGYVRHPGSAKGRAVQHV